MVRAAFVSVQMRVEMPPVNVQVSMLSVLFGVRRRESVAYPAHCASQIQDT